MYAVPPSVWIVEEGQEEAEQQGATLTWLAVLEIKRAAAVVELPL